MKETSLPRAASPEDPGAVGDRPKGGDPGDHPAPAASAWDKAIAVPLWAAGIVWIVPVMGTMIAAQLVFRSDQIEFLNRLYCWGQVLLTGSRWRAVVHPEVDPSRPYLFCQNHVNHFDHVTMYRSTPHFKQGIELKKHFDYPVYGWFMKQRGTIPIEPGGRNAEELRARFRGEIDAGHSILAFPEGTRSRDGRVGPFRTGVIRAAIELGIPIVPVAVTGMQEVMRPGSWVIRPGHQVTVYCERPVETARRKVVEARAVADEVRAPIAARVDAYWKERFG
jgi:1-acyl-sn-glycerol-3-phosphate acyltransferase